ncbi:MAG: hypothetical protein NTX14_03435 [Candidatus Nealsonbacteria bacterium]|nr:hypothetical protein [Candidatus Nealsonbacteria bacterium]
MTETTVKTLSSVLEMIAAGGLPNVDTARFLENGQGMGLKQEDLAANLAVARVIHSLHTVIFIENRRPEIIYQKNGDGQPLGFIEKIDFGLKGYEVKVPNRRIINFSDKALSHRLDRVFRALAAETRIDDLKTARNFPFEFDARVVEMAILETLAKDGRAYVVIKGLTLEPPTISSLVKKFILE